LVVGACSPTSPRRLLGAAPFRFGAASFFWGAKAILLSGLFKRFSVERRVAGFFRRVLRSKIFPKS